MREERCVALCRRPTHAAVPMTVTLYEALRAMDVVREGYAVLDHIGRGETSGEA